jgi:hypothetical protein
MKYLKLYEAFNRSNLTTKVGLDSHQFDEACHLCTEQLYEELNKEVPFEDIFEDLSSNGEAELSVASYIGTEMIGSVIISSRTLETSLEDYPDAKIEWSISKDIIEGKKGIEGVALSIKEEFRGGYPVYALLSSLKKLGDYDYIVIQQYESLKSNINYVTKGAKKLCKVIDENHPEPIDYYLMWLK